MGNTLAPTCKRTGCMSPGKFSYADPILFEEHQDELFCQNHKLENMVQIFCSKCNNVAKYGLDSHSQKANFINNAIFCSKHGKNNGIYHVVRCLEPLCLSQCYRNYNYCATHCAVSSNNYIDPNMVDGFYE